MFSFDAWRQPTQAYQRRDHFCKAAIAFAARRSLLRRGDLGQGSNRPSKMEHCCTGRINNEINYMHRRPQSSAVKHGLGVAHSPVPVDDDRHGGVVNSQPVNRKS
jgi:hypothetical protein